MEINPLAWRGLAIHEEAAAIAHGDHNDVGGTGRESFFSLLDRGDPDNCLGDLDIGYADNTRALTRATPARVKAAISNTWPAAHCLH